MSAPLWNFHLQKQVWKQKDAVVLFCFSRGVQRNDYARFFLKSISVHWYQTFQRKVCLFTSVLRPSSPSLRPWQCRWIFEAPTPPPCSMQMKLGEKLCVNLSCRCSCVCVWGLVEKCSVVFRFCLDLLLYTYTASEWRGRGRQSLNAVEVGGVFRSEPQAALYDTGFPRPTLEPRKKVNRLISSLFMGVISTLFGFAVGTYL